MKHSELNPTGCSQANGETDNMTGAQTTLEGGQMQMAMMTQRGERANLAGNFRDDLIIDILELSVARLVRFQGDSIL